MGKSRNRTNRKSMRKGMKRGNTMRKRVKRRGTMRKRMNRRNTARKGIKRRNTRRNFKWGGGCRHSRIYKRGHSVVVQ